MKLSFKETVYMSIIWLLRQMFKTNYDNIKKTKYDINSHEDYLLTVKLLDKLSNDVDNYVKSERYVIKDFSDTFILCDEIMRYEKLNGIDWLTFNDKIAIRSWRDHIKYDTHTSLFGELRHNILMEFF